MIFVVFFFFSWIASLCMTVSRSIYITKNDPFYGWVIFHCIWAPRLLYLLVCQWPFKLFPCPVVPLQKSFVIIPRILCCFLLRYTGTQPFFKPQKWPLTEFMPTVSSSPQHFYSIPFNHELKHNYHEQNLQSFTSSLALVSNQTYFKWSTNLHTLRNFLWNYQSLYIQIFLKLNYCDVLNISSFKTWLTSYWPCHHMFVQATRSSFMHIKIVLIQNKAESLSNILVYSSNAHSRVLLLYLSAILSPRLCFM